MHHILYYWLALEPKPSHKFLPKVSLYIEGIHGHL